MLWTHPVVDARHPPAAASRRVWLSPPDKAQPKPDDNHNMAERQPQYSPNDHTPTCPTSSRSDVLGTPLPLLPLPPDTQTATTTRPKRPRDSGRIVSIGCALLRGTQPPLPHGVADGRGAVVVEARGDAEVELLDVVRK